ncbi:MAG: Alpha-D-kanosaminyltransferase [Candidatus Lokiarchaeum sp. GC14_75]|nr:MAG: Alpha-D-kanosaminyltransferase [Candidatus Lokiarchaeum sp. GC14_75]
MNKVNNLKILHINPYPPDHLGGSEVFCKNLAINLKKKKNFDSDILTSDILKKNVKFDYLDGSIKIFYKKNYYSLWGINPLVNIYSFLKKNYQNYDVIHVHSYLFLTSLQSALFRKIRKFPYVLHIHGGIQTPQNLSSGLIERAQLGFKNMFFDKWIGSFTMKTADALISVSKKDLDIIKKRFNIQHNHKYYIPNGVNTEIFNKKKENGKMFVTFIGRLSYIKGFDIFMNVIKELYKNNKDLNFLIIGKGPLKKLIKPAQKNLPILHSDYYPHEKMVDIYNHSKVVLITSRFEGVPTTMLESLACETPVIASNVGGIPEVIRNDENGLLIENFNTKSAVTKIIDVLHDQDKSRTFGKNGRKLVLKDFSWDVITDKIEMVYKNFTS